MAFHHSPRIVTDDIRFYYDTHNPLCFQPSGSTFTDLSGNGVDATFLAPEYKSDGFSSNQPYYNGLSAAGATSPGSYARFNSVQTTDKDGTGNTIMFVVNKETNTSMGCLWYNGLYKQVELRTTQLYCETNTNSTYFISPTHTVGTGWMMYAFTYETSAVKWYRNGEFLGNSTSGAPADDVSFYYMGPAPYQPSLLGFFPILLWYDRVLTSDEIWQNFRAFRGRFGL